MPAPVVPFHKLADKRISTAKRRNQHKSFYDPFCENKQNLKFVSKVQTLFGPLSCSQLQRKYLRVITSAPRSLLPIIFMLLKDRKYRRHVPVLRPSACGDYFRTLHRLDSQRCKTPRLMARPYLCFACRPDGFSAVLGGNQTPPFFRRK